MVPGPIAAAVSWGSPSHAACSRKALQWGHALILVLRQRVHSKMARYTVGSQSSSLFWLPTRGHWCVQHDAQQQASWQGPGVAFGWCAKQASESRLAKATQLQIHACSGLPGPARQTVPSAPALWHHCHTEKPTMSGADPACTAVPQPPLLQSGAGGGTSCPPATLLCWEHAAKPTSALMLRVLDSVQLQTGRLHDADMHSRAWP